LHQPRTTQNHLSLRKRFTNSFAKQDYSPTINLGTPLIIKKWIDDSLSKKLLVRETVFYLGTAYESTRVKDQRQDNILREIPKKEEV
jgi:hypothetical protein